jgi:serine/threonine protein kinase
MPDPGTTLFDGRYEMLESLAAGGEAEVRRARDTRTGDEVAIRLARPEHHLTNPGEPAPMPDFHPGWVRYFRSGRDAQRGPYQVFELLRGETFSQRMEKGPFDPGEWLAFARESLAAVAALHAAGWTHGDLNAGNFVRLETSPHAWKLLELPFLHLNSHQPHTSLFGSIYTLAPEQLEGRAADTASDVYALGCLYYRGATGEFPHHGTNAEIAIARLRFPPEPPGTKAPAFPGQWAAWILTLLEREPQTRPDAAAAARHLLAMA